MILVCEYLSAGGDVPGLAPHEAAELLAQGTAMRDAMLADLEALPGVQAQVMPHSPGHDLARGLRDAALRGDVIWAVAPETGGVLEAWARAVPASQWLGCTPEAIAVAGSKRATHACLAAHGIAVPAADTGRGWVVKPDDGAGATETHWHADLAGAQAEARGREGPTTIEPWIDGEAMSLAMCCADGQAELLAVNRQRVLRDDTGQVQYHGVEPAACPPTEALRALASAVAAAMPGLRGYVGVDFVQPPAKPPVVIEVNPRLTSAYVGLSARLGFNVAARVLTTRG